MESFEQTVRSSQGHDLASDAVRVIQVNLGLLCNLSCQHCHVEASPQRQEVMTWQTMESVLSLAGHFPGCQVDLTGGAPELNPNFRAFIAELRSRSHPVQVRSNLVVFSEPEQADTPEFLASHQVQLVASLPCYLDENVDRQRGGGVYQRSVAALRRLNVLGYGRREELPLNLVYNPGGAFLPPDQAALEADYRSELSRRFGIEFSRLLAITNMPIGRFFRDLERQGTASNYEALLRDNFNPETLAGLMCRHQICVAWNGCLGDCDFNLALGLNLSEGLPRHIDQLVALELEGRQIVTGEHCFGCTAGSGSSCRGTLVA